MDFTKGRKMENQLAIAVRIIALNAQARAHARIAGTATDFRNSAQKSIAFCATITLRPVSSTELPQGHVTMTAMENLPAQKPTQSVCPLIFEKTRILTSA